MALTLLQQMNNRVESVNEFNSHPCMREFALQAAKSFAKELEEFVDRMAEEKCNDMHLGAVAQVHDVQTGETPYYWVYLVSGDEEVFEAKFRYYHDDASLAAKAEADAKAKAELEASGLADIFGI